MEGMPVILSIGYDRDVTRLDFARVGERSLDRRAWEDRKSVV